MTYIDALEIVVARTKHERYRWLCSDANTEEASREGYRFLMIRMAVSDQPTAYPSLAAQANSALRSATGFVASGLAVASHEEQSRRLSICHACEHYDAERGRCRICGCYLAWKAKIASEHCPDSPPRW